jgi:hypothetical protein
LLFREYRPEPEKLGLRLLVNRLNEATRRDVFGGMLLVPGGEARRPPRLVSAETGTLQNLAQRRRTAAKLLEYGARSSHGGAAWLAQLDDLTHGLSAEAAGDTLYQLGSRFHQSGRPELAAEVYDALVQRYHEHHLADAALVWLVHYYASGEADWRLRRETTFATGRAAAQVENVLDLPRSDTPNAGAREGAFQYERQNSSGAALGGQDRSQQALRWAKLLEASRPSLYAEPKLRFPLAVAQRRAGLPRQAEQWLAQIAAQRRGDAWQACADAAAWLAASGGSPGGNPPGKRVAHCATTADKPRLDGRLDDAVWRAALPLDLSSPLRDDGEWPAALLVARDAEYLYLAASCSKAPAAAYAADAGVRPRDADLSGHDRIEVLLDIDRDWATW